ncbi:MAG: 50S ribosomal protein L18 [Candidatus Kerfeldbacteria bacterium]|nr:50S ribosomal protein L18 [Candidatus Kerfeldbacteria bacterium]
MLTHASRSDRRRHRHSRLRTRIRGTANRPRLVVFRSLKHISAQVVDDVAGVTLVAVSDHDVKHAKGATVDVARQVGQLLGQQAKEKGIEAMVFDRGGHAFHGQVRALAEGARAAGIAI